MLMLERYAPHLAIIGCHKNGTRAAQKMIKCASSAEEMRLISQNLRPFGPPLLLDSLGNYVAQTRFGARSVRTSKHALPLEIKRVAIVVILNSIPLATNPNGTLLLTWLLDSWGLPGRYRLLAPRLHLAHLCTHKLAPVTVLRIINQNFDPAASTILLDAIFSGPRKQVLEEILADQAHGVALISKTPAGPAAALEGSRRPAMAEKVKDMLVTLRVQHIPAYKKLAEEVGLPPMTSAGPSSSSNVMTSAGAGGSTPVRSGSGVGMGSKGRTPTAAGGDGAGTL
ncbi:hypothetical protein PTTG_30737, partial [Puccinia triticina 1-1 BBBD Race 1]